MDAAQRYNALDETYRIFGEMIPAKPYGSEEGWRNVLDALASSNPKAKQLESKEIFDYTHLGNRQERFYQYSI